MWFVVALKVRIVVVVGRGVVVALKVRIVVIVGGGGGGGFKGRGVFF